MTHVHAHEDVLSQDVIADLVDLRSDVCISLYMPTVRVGDQTQQNAIRFGNLRSKAEDKLTHYGWRKPEIEALLGQLDALQGDEPEFWQQQSDGLCLFLTRDDLTTLRLPHAFEETAMIQARPYLVPLLPLLSQDAPFYLLALNLGDVRLYRAAARSLELVALEDVPLSIDQYLRFTEREKQLQSHMSRQGGAAMFHGHGAGGDQDTRKEDIREFFRQVENAVTSVLGARHAPLILVGTETNVGIYREVNQYPYLSEKHVDKNPTDMRADELYAAGAEIAGQQHEDAAHEARGRLEQARAINPDQVAEGIEQVLPAAYYQRVDTLLVPQDLTQWGTFDEAGGMVQLETQEPADELVNLSVIYTLENGGSSVPTEAGTQLAAVLRY